MKLIRKLLPAFTAAALLFSSVAPVAFADEKPVTGTFSAANVLPTVGGLEVYSDAGLTTVAPSLMPQVKSYVKVTAGDVNTIDDIDQIKVVLYYHAVGVDPAVPTTGNAQTAAIVTWDKAGGAWTLDAGGSTTWAISDTSTPAGMTASSGDWVFAITPGKVATESPVADTWDLYAQATDGTGSGSRSTLGKEMLWYGEISTSAVADFGDVTPGTGFADDVNEVSGISIKYISNGTYDQSVKSSATWTGSTYTATFDSTGVADDAQEFSLLADESGTYADRVQMTTTGAVFDTDPQTAEAGVTVATNTLWLKVAPVFNIDTYTGTITYTIQNG